MRWWCYGHLHRCCLACCKAARTPPIQLVPAQSRNVLSSYRALKHMFIGCGLMPRLVAMRPAGYGLDTVGQVAVTVRHAPFAYGAFVRAVRSPAAPPAATLGPYNAWSIRRLCTRREGPPPARIFRPFFIACCVEPCDPMYTAHGQLDRDALIRQHAPLAACASHNT